MVRFQEVQRPSGDFPPQTIVSSAYKVGILSGLYENMIVNHVSLDLGLRAISTYG